TAARYGCAPATQVTDSCRKRCRTRDVLVPGTSRFHPPGPLCGACVGAWRVLHRDGRATGEDFATSSRPRLGLSRVSSWFPELLARHVACCVALVSRNAYLAAVGGGAAVAAGVAGAGADHPAPAAGALDRVLVRVEERRLAGGRSGRVELGDLGRTGGVGRGQPRPDLRREDPDLLLVLGREGLLPHPTEDVVHGR